MKHSALVLVLLSLAIGTANAGTWKCLKQKDEHGKTVAVTCGKSTIIELYIKNGVPNPALQPAAAPVVTVQDAPKKIELKSSSTIGVDANGNTYFK